MQLRQRVQLCGAPAHAEEQRGRRRFPRRLGLRAWLRAQPAGRQRGQRQRREPQRRRGRRRASGSGSASPEPMSQREQKRPLFTGDGTLNLLGGATYSGQIVEGRAHGRGRFALPGGDNYEGEFAFDQANGEGTWRGTDGRVFTGQWLNDTQHGEGTEVLANGRTYTGSFVAGQKQGDGRYEWKDGSVYDGQFQDNYMHGQGVYIWHCGDSGRKYEGEWFKGKMHGQGKYSFSCGACYIGQYRRGQKHGGGTFTWPDGRSYTGQWSGGKQDGSGVMTNTNGETVTQTIHETWAGLGAAADKRVGDLAARVQPLEAQILEQKHKMQAVETERKRLRTMFVEEMGVVRAAVPDPVIRSVPGTRFSRTVDPCINVVRCQEQIARSSAINVLRPRMRECNVPVNGLWRETQRPNASHFGSKAQLALRAGEPNTLSRCFALFQKGGEWRRFRGLSVDVSQCEINVGPDKKAEQIQRELALKSVRKVLAGIYPSKTFSLDKQKGSASTNWNPLVQAQPKPDQEVPEIIFAMANMRAEGIDRGQIERRIRRARRTPIAAT
ncbi:unnamed protein product [Prorocentrum cordatum]|uniref:MORN repeat-containing protein 5 n=1 Tax=Prorocentrum cordatum TaxID=2364126 RepID=A0ABN9XE30_9DINO|nr:unnamed protein product [Polarella glacialis]